MSQQKAFYEIEQPARAAYVVAVKLDESAGSNEGNCMYPGCENDEHKSSLDDEVYGCDVCGGWFCWNHIGFRRACYDCMELPMAIRKEVAAFREKLNALQ